MSNHEKLIARLLKRAKEDQEYADSSQIIVDALREQMELFGAKEGGYNVNAVSVFLVFLGSLQQSCYQFLMITHLSFLSTPRAFESQSS